MSCQYAYLYLLPGNTKGGKYHCTVDLLFYWFGLVCFANKNKNFQLSYRWFQTSQTGGQRYRDTSPFSIPCCCHWNILPLERKKLNTLSRPIPEFWPGMFIILLMPILA